MPYGIGFGNDHVTLGQRHVHQPHGTPVDDERGENRFEKSPEMIGSSLIIVA